MYVENEFSLFTIKDGPKTPNDFPMLKDFRLHACAMFNSDDLKKYKLSFPLLERLEICGCQEHDAEDVAELLTVIVDASPSLSFVEIEEFMPDKSEVDTFFRSFTPIKARGQFEVVTFFPCYTSYKHRQRPAHLKNCAAYLDFMNRKARLRGLPVTFSFDTSKSSYANQGKCMCEEEGLL